MMIRTLALVSLCTALAACGGSDTPSAAPGSGLLPGGAGNSGGQPTGSNPAVFDPTAMTVDAPPVDGKLPAELLPPS